MLILVRNAMPTPVPGVPASEWELSEEGHRAAGALCETLMAEMPDARLVSSTETRAWQTLGPAGPVLRDPRFDEWQPPGGGAEDLRQLWHGLKTDISEQETEELFNALMRFGAALAEHTQAAQGRPLIIATHGVAMTYVLHYAMRFPDPLAFWDDLRFPDAVRVDLATFAVTRLDGSPVPGAGESWKIQLDGDETTCNHKCAGMLIRNPAGELLMFGRGPDGTSITPLAGHVHGTLDQFDQTCIRAIRGAGLDLKSITTELTAWRADACRRHDPGKLRSRGHDWTVGMAEVTGELLPTAGEGYGKPMWVDQEMLTRLAVGLLMRVHNPTLIPQPSPHLEPVWVRHLVALRILRGFDAQTMAQVEQYSWTHPPE